MKSLLTYFLIYFAFLLIYFLKNRPVQFPGRRSVRGSQSWLLFVFLCCSIFCYRCMFAFVMLDLVFQYLFKRLAGKNVSEMIYSVSDGAENLKSVNKSNNFG